MKVAAELIYQLPNKTLILLENALREPSLEGRISAVEAVVNGLDNMGETELANDARGALINSSLLRPDPIMPEEARLLRLGMTPNIAAYTTLLGNLENFVRLIGITEAKIVHDETSSMEGVFEFFQEKMSDPTFVGQVERWVPLAFPLLKFVSNTEFVPSHDEPLIQAADALAASIVHLSKLDENDLQLDSSEVDLAMAILCTLFVDLPIFRVIISKQFLTKIHRLIETSFSRLSNKST
jgi:hypothetical protein